MPQGNHLEAIARGNGVYVIVGDAGTVLSSTDGTNFNRSFVPVSAALHDVTFNRAKFIAVGDAGTILSSSNGSDWIVEFSGVDATIQRVAWENEAFWAATPDARTILKSTNGIHWDPQSISSNAVWSVRYLNGSYFAVGGGIFRSTNGIDWAVVGTRGGVCDIAYGNGTFVAAGSVTGSGFIQHSSNGVDWVMSSNSFSGGVLTVQFEAGKFIIAGLYIDILTSTNGDNWVNSGTSFSLSDMVYTENHFVAVGGQGTIARSNDGSVWSRLDSGDRSLLRSIMYANEVGVAVGQGVILNSSNGVDWVPKTPVSSVDLEEVAFGDGRFVAVGDKVVASLDGSSWNIVPPFIAPGSRLYGVAYGVNMFVAVGSPGNVIYTSSNGSDWAPRSIPSGSGLRRVRFCGGLFVAVGFDNRILTSTNGIDWTPRTPYSCCDLVLDVAYGNGLFVAVGSFGRIVTSTDAIAWTNQTSGTVAFLQAVSFGEGRFVAVGSSGGVFSSNDGITWENHESGAKNDLFGVTFHHDRFSTVGRWGTILQSSVPATMEINTAEAIKLRIFGAIGDSYRIDATENLGTSGWQPLTTVRLQQTPTSWVDVQSTNVAKRFYRTFTLP